MRSEELNREFAVIGVIVNSHGISGEAKISVLSDFPDRFFSLDRVWINNTEFEVEHCRPNKKFMLLKLRGIDSIDDVLPLKGKEICIPLSHRMELPEDAFYISDIIGCDVYAAERFLGTIIHVHETPAADMLLLQRDHEEFYIPFGKNIVEEIDLQQQKIVVKAEVHEI